MHGVKITTFTDYCYSSDLGVKCQGQIYLESILQLVTQTPLAYFDRGASYFVFVFESKVKVKYIIRLFRASHFGGGYSYLTQCLPEYKGFGLLV